MIITHGPASKPDRCCPHACEKIDVVLLMNNNIRVRVLYPGGDSIWIDMLPAEAQDLLVNLRTALTFFEVKQHGL